MSLYKLVYELILANQSQAMLLLMFVLLLFFIFGILMESFSYRESSREPMPELSFIDKCKAHFTYKNFAIILFLMVALYVTSYLNKPTACKDKAFKVDSSEEMAECDAGAVIERVNDNWDTFICRCP